MIFVIKEEPVVVRKIVINKIDGAAWDKKYLIIIEDLFLVQSLISKGRVDNIVTSKKKSLWNNRWRGITSNNWCNRNNIINYSWVKNRNF